MSASPGAVKSRRAAAQPRARAGRDRPRGNEVR